MWRSGVEDIARVPALSSNRARIHGLGTAGTGQHALASRLDGTAEAVEA